MITKQTLTAYNFCDINDYNHYIVESVENGQREQAADLIYEMSKKQIATFITYCDNSIGLGEKYDKIIKECRTMAINILTCK